MILFRIIRTILAMLRGPAMLGWALAGLMALTGGVYTLGRWQGAVVANSRFAATQTRLQARLIRAVESASRAEAARLSAQQQADQLAKELENAAHADDNAGRLSLGANSVRRLNRR